MRKRNGLAMRRLQRDGSCTIDAIRRRLTWFAAERNIQAAGLASAYRGLKSRKGAGHLQLVDFCDRHGLASTGFTRGAWSPEVDDKARPGATPAKILELMRQLRPRERMVSTGRSESGERTHAPDGSPYRKSPSQAGDSSYSD